MTATSFSLRLPPFMEIAHNGDRFIRRLDAHRNLQVFRIGERQPGVEHADLRPVDEALPHLAYENERHVVHMSNLEQLPNHERLEHGADPARYNHERIGGDHEVMQAGEKRLVLEGLFDERIYFLLERQLDADA